MALDYRQCGPAGEPPVVDLDVAESPLLITQIARNFHEFFQGLELGEKETFFGFQRVTDVHVLLRSLADCLGAEVSKFGRDYQLHRLDWDAHGRVVLKETSHWLSDLRVDG